MAEYIAHRRFKGIGLCGKVNIPARTKLTRNGDALYLEDGRAVCIATSENAHQYFARNDDGNGMRRGKLTQAIQKELAKRDAMHQKRWDKVWDCPACAIFQKEDVVNPDHWLWNDAFFDAGIMTLEYIAGLVGVKRG